MTQRKAEMTPTEAFLAPLVRLARRQPEIEALVFWHGPTGWSDLPTETIESEEIAFYAEGLLEDGFHLAWTVAALVSSPDMADHVRLQVWQDADPKPAALPAGWVALEAATWTAP